MKKLLAWDTSSQIGAIAAIEWDEASPLGRHAIRLVAEWTLNVNATQSERLLWGVDEVLQAARWKLEDVDVFGVGVGPGSFTGLRIGITTARTLAHTLEKPLVGVSSLAALARPVAMALSELDHKAMVVAATDACKGELFALFGLARSVADCARLAEGDYPGLWKRGVREEVLAPDALMKEILKKLDSELPWVAVGEGRRRYSDSWKALPKNRELALPLPHPDQVQGRYLAQLCWEALQAGCALDPLSVHPRYVRASDAELKLRAGLLGRPGGK